MNVWGGRAILSLIEVVSQTPPSSIVTLVLAERGGRWGQQSLRCGGVNRPGLNPNEQHTNHPALDNDKDFSAAQIVKQTYNFNDERASC